MIMRDGSETFEMWRKPPVRPQMKIYFFNLTNANEFMQGEKPKFREIGPYVYQFGFLLFNTFLILHFSEAIWSNHQKRYQERERESEIVLAL